MSKLGFLFIISSTIVNSTPPGGPWIEGDDTSVPSVGAVRPALNATFVDDIYGATIRRVTEPADNSQQWIRHEYSRRQAFNVDSSRVIMMGNAGWWYVYDVDASDNLTLNHRLPSPMSEPNWHPSDKDVYRYFPYNGGTTIKEYNVVTKTSIDLVDFTGMLPWSGITHIWTKEEGSPSVDGNTWCLLAEDSSFNTLGIFSYNLQTNTVVGTLNMTEEPDHISTSLTGSYCVPSSDGAMGTRAYSLDFSNFTQLLHKSEHSDLALDENNQDVFVTADYNSAADGGWIKMVDMQTGMVTQLVDLYPFSGAAYSMHISGNAFQKPGYFVMSTYSASLDYGATPAQYGDMWGHDKIAIVELKANPVIYNVAYMHNIVPSSGGYFAEPHVSANSDMTKILFASTWEQANLNQLATYMISINDDVIFTNGFE